MSKIEIKAMTFGYDQQETNLFENVDLSIDDSWKLGLIGRNGRGKTTLLKLLQNKLEYQGMIQHSLDFGYFPQPVKQPNQLTWYVLQEIADVEQWKMEKELNLLSVDPDVLWRDFLSLSGGEQTKVLLALLFVQEEKFPLLDEPTNHLDVLGRKQVAKYLKQKNRGFILISHDREFVDEVVDHIISIEKNQLFLLKGNFTTYEEEKKKRDQFEYWQNQKIVKETTRLKKTAREKAQWSASREKDKYGSPKKKGSGAIFDTGAIGARAARVMKRAKAVEHRLEKEISEKEQLLKNVEYIEPLTICYQPSRYQKIMKVEHLQLGYDDHFLFEPLNFEIQQGECVSLMGKNGSGKTTFIRALLAQFDGQQRGTFWLPNQIKISYIRQNYEDNQGTLFEFAEKEQLDYQIFLNNLHKLGLERTIFTQRIEQMSMGQRKKVEVAKSLSQRAHLYVWDEPLNYLDVFNQQQIEQMILHNKPTILLVEHDETFINTVSDRQIWLK